MIFVDVLTTVTILSKMNHKANLKLICRCTKNN